ncbi:hypothetical protein MoryE10_23500 [Methylogaea oryzae]|uniref:Flagellar Assembly Protein A N-terminal region domain-containing protein n=1 Tax=Methylogaea oryzae TaxID=1295382 RepID=A0A8D5AKF6_9GAMM|nr:hypothetical protein MoryE10_23500 [Methylogaea oryzae]
MLLSHSDGAGDTHVLVSEDRMSLYLAVSSVDGRKRPTLRSIKTLLAEKGVVAKIDEHLVESMLAGLLEPFSATSYTKIAAGVAPVDGENSRLQPCFTTPDGAVKQGDELAAMLAPGEGRFGVDVFGEHIPARPGEALEIRLGENAVYDEAGERIVAAADGYAAVVGNAVAVSPCFRVTVDADGYRATVSFDHPEAGLPELLRYLGGLGIVFGISQEALKQAFAQGEAAGVVAAEGVKPVPGQDAEIEFRFARRPGWQTIDAQHWKLQHQNPLAMFDAGERLVVLKPAVPGKPGKTVLGTEVPVAPVHRAAIVAGKNVAQETVDGVQAFSGKIRGAPILHGNTLDVVDEYVVEGDARPDGGEIRFAGNVVIRGDVASGDVIYSDRDIVVKGAVYDATLHAKGNIVVDSGIHGAKAGKVVCGGNLTAKYLDDCCIEVAGDVVIANEIIASHVYCLGVVRCGNGSIYGGEVVALKGVEAKHLGNASYMKTRVVAGRDYTLLRELKQHDHQKNALNAERVKINDQVQQYKVHPEVLAHISATQRQELRGLLLRLTEIAKQMEEADARFHEGKQRELAAGVREILVRKGVYPGVYVEMGGACLEVREEVAGPVKIAFDGKVTFIRG